MSIKSIGPIVAASLLWAFASTSSCGGESKTSNSGSSAGVGGMGGSGGGNAGGRGGSAGSQTDASVTSTMCGTASCENLTIPFPGAPAVPACCPTGMEDTCGLDTTLLSVIGISFEETCQALDQPGALDPDCPESESVSLDGGATVQLPGCCRDGVCGYMVDSIMPIAGLPLVIEVGLGCVDSAPFLDGGTPASCGQGGSGGGAGTGGTAGDGGDPGSGGADGGMGGV